MKIMLTLLAVVLTSSAAPEWPRGLNGLPACSAAEPWPQWRGPDRTGQVVGPAWPASLSNDSLQLLWRVPLGPSYSGPIVSDKLVFTTETLDKEFEVVHALDRETGEQVWRQQWPGSMKVPFFAASNGSWIRATPAYDGESVYIAGMRDVLVCLNAETGDERWRVDFVERLGTPLPSFGLVSSPLVDGDAIYIQAGASVVKLDKKSGEVVWRALSDAGGMEDSAFSSPIITSLAGKRQLVVQTREDLAGVDLESGEVLWKQNVPAFRGMNIQTPLVVGDGLFTSSYQNKSWLYQVKREVDAFTVTTAWENPAQGYMSTPVVVNGHAYMHLQNGRFTCVDLETGERTWTSKPEGKYASLVAQGNQILALNSTGKLLLFEANPEQFTLLGEATVSDEETWAHLAISGNQVFVREQGGLAAYRWK